MRHRSRSRAIAALIALASMLFMQLALAGYACPSLKVAHEIPAEMSNRMSTDQAMQGCHGMDKVQPNLCQAHDQAGKQSLDKPELPSVQPFIAGSILTTVFREIELAAAPVSVQAYPLLLTRTTAPPLSIQLCCFRI